LSWTKKFTIRNLKFRIVLDIRLGETRFGSMGNPRLEKEKFPERRQGGFTLIEILVAMFIFALVVPTILAAYQTTIRITSGAEYGDQAFSMGRSAIDRFTKDLESICTNQGVYRFKLQQATVHDQTVPMLSFFSSAHIGFSGRRGDAGTALISYHVEKGDGGDYSLMRTDGLIRGNQTDSTAEPFTVCEHVKSLTLRFYDVKGQEYTFWDSDSDIEAQKKKAPTAVLVDLQLVNPEGPAEKGSPYRFMTRIKIGASWTDNELDRQNRPGDKPTQ
jgi:general secretion pathway protein J